MFKPKLGSKGTSKCSQGSTFSLYPSWVAHDGRILKRNSRVCVCVDWKYFPWCRWFLSSSSISCLMVGDILALARGHPPLMGMYLRSTHLEMDKPGIISIIKQIQSCLEPNCCKTFFGQFGTHPPILVCNGVSIFLVILCRWCSWRCHRDLLTTSPSAVSWPCRSRIRVSASSLPTGSPCWSMNSGSLFSHLARRVFQFGKGWSWKTKWHGPSATRMDRKWQLCRGRE